MVLCEHTVFCSVVMLQGHQWYSGLLNTMVVEIATALFECEMCKCGMAGNVWLSDEIYTQNKHGNFSPGQAQVSWLAC